MRVSRANAIGNLHVTAGRRDGGDVRPIDQIGGRLNGVGLAGQAGISEDELPVEPCELFCGDFPTALTSRVGREMEFYFAFFA